MPRANSKNAWQLILGYKCICAITIGIGFFCEFDTRVFQASVHWPIAATEPALSSRLACWDSAYYLVLVRDGYQPGSSACAFYPLWPTIIRGVSWLIRGNPLLIAMLLANALSVVALWQFYRLVEQRFGEMIARDALILFMAFPGALFLSFPYTESLYLVLVLFFFRHLQSGRYALAAIAGFLLPLTRAVGVLIVVPLVWHLFERQRRVAKLTPADTSQTPRKEMRPLHWTLALCPLLGYAAYLSLMRAWTGNAFEGFTAQKFYPNSQSIRNIFNYTEIWRALVGADTLNGLTSSVLDRSFFLMFLVLLPLTYRLDKTWFFYVLPTGLIPALSNWFMSYRRYVMVLFPIFIVLALVFRRPALRKVFWYYIALLSALQVWAILQFVNFKWAG